MVSYFAVLGWGLDVGMGLVWGWGFGVGYGGRPRPGPPLEGEGIFSGRGFLGFRRHWVSYWGWGLAVAGFLIWA